MLKYKRSVLYSCVGSVEIQVEIEKGRCTADIQNEVLGLSEGNMILSDEGPTLKTLDFAFYIGSTPTFYISICILEHIRQSVHVI